VIKRFAAEEEMRSTAGHNTKYVWIAYLSWFFLGWAGIHHFYLRRYRQGVLWLTSFGGLFGIGWLRDFLRLPTYVRDANDDPEFIEEFKLELRYSSMNPDRISDDPVGTIGEQSNKDQGHQGVDNNSNGDRNIHGIHCLAVGACFVLTANNNNS
jgi:TM2 domain-containing membrane protein YozV